MFNDCFALKDLNIINFNLTLVKSLEYFLSGCKALTSILLPKLNNAISLINLSHMFQDCFFLKYLDLSNFNATKVKYMDYMFMECFSLIELNLTNFIMSSVSNMQYMFSGCSSLSSLDLSTFDTKNVKYMNGLFYGCSNIKYLNLSNFNTEATSNMAFMFYNMKSMVTLDISSFNTINLKIIHYMFCGCESIESVDVSKFNTSNILTMNNMFSYCKSLINVDLSNFDTSSVISMKFLFNECKSLINLNILSFNTSLINSMDNMFTGCKSLVSLNLSNFDTSSVTSMESLFSNCYSLEYLIIDNFNTSSMISMRYMFSHCRNLSSINLINFDTFSVKFMDYMFEGCISLKNININNFNTSSVLSMSHMFEGCISLTSLNLSNFVTNNLKNMDYMFSNNIKLNYVNLYNMDDKNLKSMNYILYKTQENMVFCINESNTNYFNKLIFNKGCSVINCSLNWIENRKKIYEKTKECIEECSSIGAYFYDFICYDECPLGTYPYNYICNTKDKYLPNITLCDVRQYFLKIECLNDLNNSETKRKFIEKTMKSFLSRELYDFVLKAKKDKDIISLRTDKELYQIYALSNKKREDNFTYIDFNECTRELRKRHNLKKKDDIIIFKIEYYSDGFKIPIIEYILLNSVGTNKLHLLFCKNIKIKYYIPKEIIDFEDYKYNPLSKYYHDECSPYVKDNTDFILYDRRNEFDNNNMSLCESICEFKGIKKGRIECECKIKTIFNSYLLENSDKYNLIYRFNEKLKIFSLNIWVTKCFFNVWTKENLYSNIFSFILLGILLINIIGALLFRFIEYDIFINKLNKIIEIAKIYFDIINKRKNEVNNNNKKNEYNDNKIKDNEKNNNIYLVKHNLFNKTSRILNVNKKNIIGESSSATKLKNYNSRNSSEKFNIEDVFDTYLRNQKKNIVQNKKLLQEYLTKTDNELNFLKYKEALMYDKRTFCQYYISLIRAHQLLVFTFKSKNDYNPRTIKICLFFFILALMIVINILFVDEYTLHHLYINKGKFDIPFIFTKVVYTTIISYLLKIMLSLSVSTENLFLYYKKEKISKKSKVGSFGIKCAIFLGFGIIILLFFWIYIICFFSVFPRSQIFIFVVFGLSFFLILILPFIVDIIPSLFRSYSLVEGKDREYSFKFSKFIQYI